MNKLFIPPALIVYSIILMVLSFFFLPDYNLIKFPFDLAGLLISFPGFIIMGKTNDSFKKHNTTTAIKESSHLINEGVFAKSRNPMYLGMFLLLLGFSILSTNIIAIATPFLFITIIRIAIIPKEEKLMHTVFGDEYLEYKKKVRRFI